MAKKTHKQREWVLKLQELKPGTARTELVRIGSKHNILIGIIEGVHNRSGNINRDMQDIIAASVAQHCKTLTAIRDYGDMWLSAATDQILVGLLWQLNCRGEHGPIPDDVQIVFAIVVSNPITIINEFA